MGADAEGPILEEAGCFSSSGERLIFENVPWKDWELAGVEAVQASLDKGARPVGRSKPDLLRFLHLAIFYRNDGHTGSDFTEEDVIMTVDLLLQNHAWKEKNQPLWTPKLRNAYKDMVFHLDGRDKRGRPVAVVRPLEDHRELWIDVSDICKCILALLDEMSFIPGVAEQSVVIVDLHAIGLADLRKLPAALPVLKAFVKDLTDQFPARGGTIYILNAGWALSTAVNTVMMFAAEETRSKMQLYRGTFEQHAEELFDLAVLPVEFGGEAAMGCLSERSPGGQGLRVHADAMVSEVSEAGDTYSHFLSYGECKEGFCVCLRGRDAPKV